MIVAKLILLTRLVQLVFDALEYCAVEQAIVYLNHSV